MSVRGSVTRASAVVGLGIAQLRRSPGRAALTATAVALAVLSVTLLASLGIGVVELGEEGLDEAGRDVWISSDPMDPSSGGSGNPIVGSHEIAADVDEREDVRVAAPVAMHDVYIGSDPSDLERVSAIGVRETHDGFDFEEGGGFDAAAEDLPDDVDPIVVDPEIADRHGLSVGDTIYLGTSRETAPVREFTVVGTSSYYSQFLGSPAMTVPLAELQAIAGTSGTDRATFVTVDVTEGTDREAVRDDLAEEYPEYDVRTSDEQLEAMLEERTLVLASGVTLVALAVVGGVILTVNLFALVAYGQRRELAALRAIGLSRGMLAGTIGVQGFVTGLAGGLVGLAATPPLVRGLNEVATSFVGFERILRTTPEVYAVGFVIALGVGTIAAVVTGWRAGRYARIDRFV